MRRKHSLTLEERTLIVQEHLENKKTLRQLTEEFDVSKSTICRILQAYRENGSQGLKAPFLAVCWQRKQLHSQGKTK